MKLDGIREKVFLDRYSFKDKAGLPTEKAPEEMWRRIAKAISQVEEKGKQKIWEEKFYHAMEDFKYVPGGRILSGAGTGFKVTFYNCFVLPSPKDSRDGILDNLKSMIEIMARGGGVGVNLSSLRPRGARVKKVNGFSSGPCNWAELYSLATKDIIQQGGTRRGALMLMLWDWHPDIEEFITVKQDLSRINGANLSVCVSDKFMQAVKEDKDWDLVFPDTADPDYDKAWDGYLANWEKLGKKVIKYKTVRARNIWNLIAEAAWKSAEPGVVFMERYNKWNNNWYYNTINCVNPCGEEGLPAWGVCNLGSLNLAAFVDGNGAMDYQSLAEHAKIATRFQDNVIDADNYVFKEIEDTQLNGERRIGVGTMGLGDAFIKMKVRYGADESIKIIEKIFSTIRDAVYEASVEIAKEKSTFPAFRAAKYLQGYFIKNLPKKIRDQIKKHGIRNSVLLQEAPTGSTSLLAGTSSGIEPVYEFEFIRRDRLGEHVLYHPLYEEWKKNHPNENKPDYFVSANDLTPEDHVRVQAAIQKYVDASISKTVNAPAAHTVEDVKRLYTLAYDLGCKGIAYMREGSRAGVLERINTKKEENASQAQKTILKRPTVLQGVTYQTGTPLGDAFITINNEGQANPFELFITIGKSGSDVAGMAEALGRTISLVLRLQSQVAPREKIRQIIAQLTGIGGVRSVGFGENKVRSLPDAVAKVLAEHFDFKVNGAVKDDEKKEKLMNIMTNNHQENGNIKLNHEIIPADSSVIGKQLLEVAPQMTHEQHMFDLCPACGVASLAFEEGCKKCYSCGYSEC